MLPCRGQVKFQIFIREHLIIRYKKSIFLTTIDYGNILWECNAVEKLGIEFAIHKIGQTNSINVVLLCNMESFGFGIRCTSCS